MPEVYVVIDGNVRPNLYDATCKNCRVLTNNYHQMAVFAQDGQVEISCQKTDPVKFLFMTLGSPRIIMHLAWEYKRNQLPHKLQIRNQAAAEKGMGPVAAALCEKFIDVTGNCPKLNGK